MSNGSSINSLGISFIALSGTGIAFIFLLIGCNADNERVFWTPYKDLNWERIGHYDAQFHIHPGLGGEEYNPHLTIDRYREEG